MKGRNILISILVSASAGAIAGILFAPDKGSKTRSELSKRAGKISDLTRDEFEEFMNYTRKKYNEARSQTDDLIEKGEAKAEELKNKIKQ